MTHPRAELRLAARARDLPESIEVDVSTITELHGAILISDLPESATYKYLDPPEEVLAMVQPPKGEAEVSKWLASARQYGRRPVGCGRGPTPALGGPTVSPGKRPGHLTLRCRVEVR